MAEGRDSPLSPPVTDALGAEHPSRQRLYSTDSALSMELEVPHQEAQMANTRLEHLALLDIFSQPNVVRNTGIVCTIGKRPGGSRATIYGVVLII